MTYEDHFSRQSESYAAYRPTYPPELYEYLASIAPSQQFAWDCATGSGQAARGLAQHFEQVIATDASADQLSHATPHDRVTYRVAHAEASGLEDTSVDLIGVAQAVHWFDLDAFYNEARRVLKPGGVLAIWTYFFPEQGSGSGADEALRRFYFDVIGDYWADQLKAVYDGYRTLPFPFAEIETPPFTLMAEWSLQQAVGFLDSWSGVQSYIAATGTNPVEAFLPELRAVWGDAATLPIRWPIYLRAGRDT